MKAVSSPGQGWGTLGGYSLGGASNHIKVLGPILFKQQRLFKANVIILFYHYHESLKQLCSCILHIYMYMYVLSLCPGQPPSPRYTCTMYVACTTFQSRGQCSSFYVLGPAPMWMGIVSYTYMHVPIGQLPESIALPPMRIQYEASAYMFVPSLV